MGTAGETVSVACKLPHGLILHLDDMVPGFEPAPGGSRAIMEARRRPEVFKVAGVGFPQNGNPENRPQMVGGYALTTGIPADFWEKWLEDNKDSDYVRNNLIFATKKGAGIMDMAKEHAKQRSGLEPLNPDKIIVGGREVPADPRIPSKVERFKKE
jgi:hypothetical protein